MSSSERILDRVREMVVAIGSAHDAGISFEMPDREYAFCSQACPMKFAKSPQFFRVRVDH